MPRLQNIGPNIWIAEGPSITFLAMRITTRSTIVKLTDGSIWFHSPIAFDEDLAREISSLGQIRYLVAPNIYHHLYLGEWQARYPDAQLIAAPGLSAKRPDLDIAQSLNKETRTMWPNDIEQIKFSGSRMFDEYIFVHAPSSTAILTDLIVNIRAEHQSTLGHILSRIEGVTYPNGRTPLLYRLSMNDKEAGASAVRNLLAYAPSQAVISHGEWFRENATDELRKRFAWLPL